MRPTLYRPRDMAPKSDDTALAPHRRFDAAAAGYSRARPPYPPELVPWVVETAGLATGASTLDLAAGTGALTAPLAEAGLAVTAVEPSAGMRAVLAERAPGVETVVARAEELPFADGAFELITVGNAWHWFDPATAHAEIRRVLAPGGTLAVIWNVEDRADALSRRVDDLKLRVLDRSQTPGPHEEEPLAWERHFEQYAREEFRFVHRPPSVAEYVASWSFVANMSEAEREDFLAEIRGWTPDDGPAELPFRANATLGHRREAAGR
jgi:SAM-dependent methyltransferase